MLSRAAGDVGTPVYVYDLDVVLERAAWLREAFGERFGISYSVKANPNIELLRRLRPAIAGFDASSYAEVERIIAAGAPTSGVTFSGPAKREEELRRAISRGVGELVVESMDEAVVASRLATSMGVTQTVLVRINPMRLPRTFSVTMAGRASQFGVDEEVMEPALDAIQGLPGLDLAGFHIYSGTNSVEAEAIAENFGIFVDIFQRAAAHAGIAPRKLVFGSGFGIAYVPGQPELDVETMPGLINPMIDTLRQDPRFANTKCALEMGRWLVGPAGWLLTRVVRAKSSRGTEFRACDAGFNNHLVACGMMGTVIRRNWRFDNLSHPQGEVGRYTLVGPLCTTIDVLASAVDLPEPRVGDVIAVAQSGAYGLTASPTRFISHPEPREILLDGGTMVDVTETRLNAWGST
jgi:diaminopimelate decarboxylase